MELDLLWTSPTLQLTIAGGIAGVALVLIWILVRPGWMGFSGKTLWDWLVVLAVPTVLSVATMLISAGQARIAEARAQEEALQQYIDRISALTLAGQFRTAAPDAIAVGRAQTLAVLQIVDGARSGRVLSFLDEIGLMGSLVTSLEGLNFSGAELKGLALSDLDLEEADLSGADLEQADLSGADLEEADLRNADLKEATLSGADMEGAAMAGARLDHADLRGANLAGATGIDRDELEKACLDDKTVLPAGLSVTDWTGCSGKVQDDD
jgi:hypothetical protein